MRCGKFGQWSQLSFFFGCVSSPNIHFAGAEVCLAVTFDVLVHYIKLSSNRVKVLGVNRDWNVIWRPVPLKQRLRVNWRPVHSKLKDYSGCPTKNYTLFWRAVAPLNFELGIKVRGVLESSGSQLFKTVPTFDF